MKELEYRKIDVHVPHNRDIPSKFLSQSSRNIDILFLPRVYKRNAEYQTEAYIVFSYFVLGTLLSNEYQITIRKRRDCRSFAMLLISFHECGISFYKTDETENRAKIRRELASGKKCIGDELAKVTV